MIRRSVFLQCLCSDWIREVRLLSFFTTFIAIYKNIIKIRNTNSKVGEQYCVYNKLQSRPIYVIAPSCGKQSSS